MTTMMRLTKTTVPSAVSIVPVEDRVHAASVDLLAQCRCQRHSPTIPKLLQIGGDGGVELCGLGLLLAQRRGEPLHLLLERLAVVLLRLCADVAAGREHVAVLADVVERGGFAEAGDVCVFTPISIFPRRGRTKLIVSRAMHGTFPRCG